MSACTQIVDRDSEGFSPTRSLLTMILMATGLWSPFAQAQVFDLDCAPLHDDNTPNFGGETEHYQIDIESRRWCEDRCDKIETSLTVEDDLIYLHREHSKSADLTTVLDQQTGRLEDRYSAGASHERIRPFDCKLTDFSGLKPYLVRRPQPIGAFRVATEDFIRDEFGKFPGGSVGFEITVSSTGQLIECTAPLSSGKPALDAHTCQLAMSRMRFKPATNRDGNNVEGLYRNVVRWNGDDD